MTFPPKDTKWGFTVVELLVVLAIIGLLASIILTQLQSSRARARDAEREQEIKTIQNGLAIYAVNRGLYPVYDGALTGSDLVSTTLINENAVPQMPRDPINSGNYVYRYASVDGSTYVLSYYLETDSIQSKPAGQHTASP